MNVEKKNSRIGRALIYFFLVIWAILVLFPFYWIFITSIKEEAELYGAVTYWPRAVNWENYKKLFTTTVNFVSAMKNSFIAAGLTTIVSLTASTLAAYAFSRYRFKGRRVQKATLFWHDGEHWMGGSAMENVRRDPQQDSGNCR